MTEAVEFDTGGEARWMYAGLVYNWETRYKKFFQWNEVGDIVLGEGDQLYLLDVTLEPPVAGEKAQRAWCRLVRHDNPRPLEPGRALHDHILSGIQGAILQSLPAGTFGPDIGPYQGHVVSYGDRSQSYHATKAIVAFSVPGHYFKLTLEELSPEEGRAIMSLPLP